MNPNTILHKLAQLSGKPRAAPEFQNLAAAAAAVTGPDSVKHYIVSGRIPGDDEDTVEHIKCKQGEDPWVTFVEHVLYEDVVPTEDYEAQRAAGRRRVLPSDWQRREMVGECDNAHGEWAYGGVTIRILGPPLSRK